LEQALSSRSFLSTCERFWLSASLVTRNSFFVEQTQLEITSQAIDHSTEYVDLHDAEQNHQKVHIGHPNTIIGAPSDIPPPKPLSIL
jgi:hypothetical protein